jgi:ribonuclease HI
MSTTTATFSKRLGGKFILERINWTMEFLWVKAHTGIYENELADRLPKMQRETETERSFSTELQRAHCTVK